ncbi:MAG: Uncharacterised protein [Flavobacteriia bacterium]|nr:MAG: Uncharacterised protein [Flavobacteriia bacterium]
MAPQGTHFLHLQEKGHVRSFVGAADEFDQAFTLAGLFFLPPFPYGLLKEQPGTGQEPISFDSREKPLRRIRFDLQETTT